MVIAVAAAHICAVETAINRAKIRIIRQIPKFFNLF